MFSSIDGIRSIGYGKRAESVGYCVNGGVWQCGNRDPGLRFLCGTEEKIFG